MKRLSKQCANGRAPLPLRLWAHGVHERRPCIPAPLLSCPTQHCSWYALVCGRHPPAQLPHLGASTWKGKPMTWSPLTAAATRAKSPGRLFSRWWQLLLASCAHLEQLGEGEEAEVLDQIHQAQTRSPTMSSAARDGLERTAQRAWLQKGQMWNYEPAAANHRSVFQDHTLLRTCRSSPGEAPATPAPRHCTGAPQRPHVVEDPCA